MDGCQTKSLQKMVVQYRGAVATNDEEKWKLRRGMMRPRTNMILATDLGF